MVKYLQYIEVRMYEGERRGWFGPPEYQRLIQQLWLLGAPGATVIRADEGFDNRGHLQNIHSEYLSDNLPVTLEFVGKADELRAAVARIKEEVKRPIEAWTRDVIDVKVGAKTISENGEWRDMLGILKVYCKEQDEVDGIPLSHALPEQLHAHGVTWINVFQALQGFGKDHVIRKNSAFSFANHAPVVIEAVLSRDVDVNKLLSAIAPLLQSASGPAILIPGEFLNT